MYTSKTFEILNEVAPAFVNLRTHPSIENVHLRGAMFGFYKAGSNVKKVDGKWPSKGLQLMKLGKLFRMLGGNECYTDANVETYVNKIKSRIALFGDEHGEGIDSPYFSVVTGDMIGFYYLEHNYAPIDNSSNLMGSCMRYESCQGSFRLYQENPDKISMLVLRNTDYKIVSRALLWFDGENTYMDTIYHITDAHREQMIAYAHKHNIYYKAQQSCHYFAFDMLNGNKVHPKILVMQLNYSSEWSMPWLDTMMYGFKKGSKYYLTNTMHSGLEADELYHLRTTNGRTAREEMFIVNADRMLHSEVAFTLLYNKRKSNAVKEFLDKFPAVEKHKDILSSSITSGEFASIIKDPTHESSSYKKYFLNEDDDKEDRNEDGEVWVEYRRAYYNEEDCVLDVNDEWILYDDAVEVDGDWYHLEDECIRYSESRGRYYHQDDVSWVESRGDYYPNHEVVYDEYNSEDIHQDNAMYIDDYGYVHEDDVQEVAVFVDGDWVLIDKCFKCEISGKWFLKSDRHELPDGRIVCQKVYDNWTDDSMDNEEEVDEEP